MDALPLAAPDGTIYTWICGKCRHVCGSGEYILDHTDEQCVALATSAKVAAERCCACAHCGVHVPRPAAIWKGSEVGEPIRPTDCCDTCWQSKYRAEVLAQQLKWAAAQQETAARYEQALTKAADSNAARQLESLISEISEEVYAAGWLSDIEHTLWGQLVDSSNYAFGLAYADQLDELRRLHEKCGGWWTYRTFVTTAEWLPIHAEYNERLALREKLTAKQEGSDG